MDILQPSDDCNTSIIVSESLIHATGHGAYVQINSEYGFANAWLNEDEVKRLRELLKKCITKEKE